MIPADWIQNPFAIALGWALFQFVWQGVLIAVPLEVALALMSRRHAKLRYTLSIAALATMPAAFGITLALALRTPPDAGAPWIGLFAGSIADKLPWAVPIWMAGVLLLYARDAVCLVVTLRLRRRGVCEVPITWRHWLSQTAAKLKLTRRIVILESCLIDVPVVIGMWKPLILVPAGLLTGLPQSYMEAILIHELAHIRRHDYFVNLLQTLIEGLLFYHPGVWWVSAQVRAERENCCDDLVVAIQRDPRSYAKALASLEEIRGESPEFGLAAVGGNLGLRIRRILGKPEGPRNLSAPLLGAGLWLMLLSSAIFSFEGAPRVNPMVQSDAPRLSAPLAKRNVAPARPALMAGLPLLQVRVATAAKPEEESSIEGKIVNRATGEPLRKAVVQLRPIGAPGLSAVTPTAITDTEGKFEMVNVTPGTYRVMADHAGFVQVVGNSAATLQTAMAITLARGDKKTGVDLELAPQGVITGRILTEYGEPAIRASVSALQARYMNGKKQLNVVASTTSDDRGMYRFAKLAPGGYAVVALARLGQGVSAIDVSGKKESSLPTFYPGVTDQRLARTVNLLSGVEAQGIDVTLKSGKVVTVSGRLVVPPGVPPIEAIQMTSASGLPGGFKFATPSGPQNRFEFSNVGPGVYNVFALRTEAGKSYGEFQTVEVGSENIENLILRAVPSMNIDGELVLDNTSAADRPVFRIFLRPVDGGNGALAQIDGAGVFQFSNVMPGRYSIAIYDLPAKWFLKSMRMGETDLLGNPLDVSGGASGSIRIVLSSNGGTVNGSVVNKDSKPVREARVVLVPEKAAWKNTESIYKTVVAGPDGRFTVQGVLPGDYRIFAWREVEDGAWMNQDFLTPVMSLGKRITVKESGSETVSVQPVDGDAR